MLQLSKNKTIEFISNTWIYRETLFVMKTINLRKSAEYFLEKKKEKKKIFIQIFKII